MQRKLRSSNSDVKDERRTEIPIQEDADKNLEMIKVERHVRCRSIGQEMKIDPKTISNHLNKTGSNKKLMFGLMNRVFICESLAKRNETQRQEMSHIRRCQAESIMVEGRRRE